MINKYIISEGTDKIQSVSRNTFNQSGSQLKTFSFTPRRTGEITPADNEYISIERRRRYRYYEKK